MDTLTQNTKKGIINMVKGNIHKKITNEDKFARKYYCEHARLNSVRFDKKFNKRKLRRYLKDLDNI